MSRKTRSNLTSTSDGTTEEIKQIRLLVEQLVEENKGLKEKINESLKSTEFFNKKYDDNEERIKEVLTKLSEQADQNKKLMERNMNLEKQIISERDERKAMEERFYQIINPIEVERRYTNLELHGLPERENEDCNKVVSEVLFSITPGTITIAKSFTFGRSKTSTGEKRIRPILIIFNNKGDRDIAFKSKSNLKKFDDKSLFLNENLPPYLSILRGKANSIRKERDYKYL